VPRKSGDPAYNEVKISRSKTESVVATSVARELLETKGDCLAFIGVLLDYHKSCNKELQDRVKTTNKTNHHLQSSMKEESNDRLRDTLVEHLTPNKIKEFAKDVDDFYLDALKSCVGFTEATGYLISDEVNVHFYNWFKNEFPFLHLVMYSVVESKDFKEEIGIVPYLALKTKQRMMLYLFYSLIRTRSQQLMKHWAIIEPLAHFYKGNTQHRLKSMGDAFVSTQFTGFKALDDIYEERHCKFEATLD
jgi:hypothetical protein